MVLSFSAAERLSTTGKFRPFSAIVRISLRKVI